jgi:signal transduction histidine kinase
MFTTASTDSPIGVSAVEEIPSSSSPPSLSVTLFGGLDTLGVLVIWPSSCRDDDDDDDDGWAWTSDDKLQVSRAARSLALALSMDSELATSRIANEKFRLSLADGLHQVKSPLQALRTFGKLLQRQLAEGDAGGEKERAAPASSMQSSSGGGGAGGGGRSPRHQRAMKLAEDIMSQGERVIDLIEPMDALIRNDIGEGGKYLLRGDVKERVARPLPLLPPTWEDAAVAETSTTAQIVPYHRQYLLPPPMPVLGDFQFEMAFPQDVLGSIVYASQAISREAGIKLDAVGFEPDNPDLPGVTVCARQLTEAVSNLLDNAVKYAPLRGRKHGKKLVGRPRIPQIRVTLVSNEPPLAPGATLYIEDNGPGIPASERDEVFARGYRGRTVQDEVDGSGLGLAIAKDTITRMGGVLDIVDEGPNRLNGTTVRVILFRDPDPPVAASSSKLNMVRF